MKSFRVRIIVWTSLISGLVMLAFGIAGILAYENAKRAQVDTKLERLVNRPFPFPFHQGARERIGEELKREMYSQFGADSVFAVYGREWNRDGRSEEVAGVELFFGELAPLYASEADWPAVKPLPDFPNRRDREDMRSDEREDRNDRRDGPPRFAGRGSIGRGVELSQFSLRASDGKEWRVGLAHHSGFNALAAVSLDGVSQDLALMRNRFAIAFPLALALLSISIWIFATKAIRPVRTLTKAVETISAKNLGSRLDETGGYSEFAALTQHFNAMLERLERSFLQASRFGADAAHELKTPLSILQGQLEVALQQAPDGTEAQKTFAGLLDETNRLKAIVRKLLILAKADAGSLEIKLEGFSLGALVEEQLALSREDNAEVRFAASLGSGSMEAFGDVTLTAQIVSNLLSNAVKYHEPEGSEIGVELEASEDQVFVRVRNRCGALSSEERSRLFDRFVRVDEARNRMKEGIGLGLSLSLEFARAQKGELTIEDSESDEAISFLFSLPRFRSGS